MHMPQDVRSPIHIHISYLQAVEELHMPSRNMGYGTAPPCRSGPQHLYSQILGTTMKLYSYDEKVSDEVLDWFRNSILPFVQSKGAHYVPHLTHNQSPFAPSINISGGENKIVRFTVEAIGPYAGTPTDQWNQEVQRKMMENLDGKLEGLDLALFNHFSNAFFVQPDEQWRNPADKLQMSPSAFVAFDISPTKGINGIGAKAYLFPKLKSLASGLSPGSTVEEAIKGIHNPKDFDVLPALNTVIKYLDDAGNALTLNDVEMLGVDCVSLDKKPRVKIYAHCHKTFFQAAKNIYTLGGRLPEDKEAIDALEEMWKILFHYGKNDMYHEDWDTTLIQPVTPHLRSFFVYSFEITPGQPLPAINLYFPMWCHSLSDADLVRRLSSFYLLRGWSDAARSYQDNLNHMFPAHDLENEKGLHTYISFTKSGKKGDYVTVCLAPKSTLMP